MKSSLRFLTFLACLAVASVAVFLLVRPRLSEWQKSSNTATVDPASTGKRTDHLQTVLALNIHPDDSGDRQLLMTIASLETHSSIAARIRQHARIGKHPFEATGTYRQQGGGTRRNVRWLLNSQLNSDTSLMQVSDGRFLWTVRNLASGQYIDSVDLWQLRRKSSAAPASPPAAGEASSAPITPQATAGFGGLPMLLESLRENFEFTAPRQFRMPDGSEVIGMIGRWHPEALATVLLGASKKGESKSDEPEEISAASLREQLEQFLLESPLPQRIPHHVLLLVGKQDLFPRLVEYRHQFDPLADPQLDEGELFQFSSEPLAKLEFYEIEFDSPIDNREFNYTPPAPQWRDKTSVYEQRLERMQQLRTALEQERRMANSPGELPR